MGHHVLLTCSTGARSLEVRLNCSLIAGRFDYLPLIYWNVLEAVSDELGIRRSFNSYSTRLQYSGVANRLCLVIFSIVFTVLMAYLLIYNELVHVIHKKYEKVDKV